MIKFLKLFFLFIFSCVIPCFSSHADPIDLSQQLEAGDIEAIQSSLLENEVVSESLYRAIVLFYDEDYEQAETFLENYVEEKPNDGRGHYWLGRTYIQRIAEVSFFSKKGLVKKAGQSFDKALALKPGDIDVMEMLVYYHTNVPPFLGGDKTLAMRYAEQMLRSDKARGLHAQGLVQAANEEYQPAIKSFNEAIQQSEQMVYFYHSLAILHFTQEQYTEAIDVFQALFNKRLQPARYEFKRLHQAAYYLTGKTASEQGVRLEQGIEALQVYLTQSVLPGNKGPAWAQLHLANLLLLTERTDKAKTIYQSIKPPEDKDKQWSGLYKRIGKQLD